MDNIVLAPFNTTGKVKTRSLYRYDYGQVLKITGVELPASYIVHFSNEVNGYATTAIGNADGVAIPDEYLQSEKDVYAWLFLNTGADDGETVFHITIPVTNRAKPTDAHPTQVQQDAIAQAIAILNEATGQWNDILADITALKSRITDLEAGKFKSDTINFNTSPGTWGVVVTKQFMRKLQTMFPDVDPEPEEPVPEEPIPDDPDPEDPAVEPTPDNPVTEEPVVEEP